ncbi:MAG: hypothetical protein D9C04_04965 [Nitrosopumilus sp. B06]|nr:MAG: hypothetical protein D9C04_04965 [Nitrosopumilus sp. B06]
MTRIGTGDKLYTLRQEIQRLRGDLGKLGKPEDMPELITSANMLRANEHLSETGSKQTELLDAYSRYCETLEEMLLAVFEIQNDLKDILKEQSKLIRKKRPKKRPR